MASDSPHGSEKNLATDLKNINADLEQVKEDVPRELDLDDRDPTEMNEFVKVCSTYAARLTWEDYKCYNLAIPDRPVILNIKVKAINN